MIFLPYICLVSLLLQPQPPLLLFFFFSQGSGRVHFLFVLHQVKVPVCSYSMLNTSWLSSVPSTRLFALTLRKSTVAAYLSRQHLASCIALHNKIENKTIILYQAHLRMTFHYVVLQSHGYWWLGYKRKSEPALLDLNWSGCWTKALVVGSCSYKHSYISNEDFTIYAGTEHKRICS